MQFQTRHNFRWLSLTLIILIMIGGALTLAYAQSGSSAFNLNSPASFPVDI